MRIKLDVVMGSAEPSSMLMDSDSLVIGRSSSADLVIREPAVSRRHARIFTDGGQILIEDLDSNNGTWINGEEVCHALQVTSGSLIQLAKDPDTGECVVILKVNTTDDDSSEDLTFSGRSVIKSAMELLSTEQMMAKDQSDIGLRDYATRLKLINEVHTALARSENVDTLLEIILNKLFELLTPENATIFLRNEANELFPAAVKVSPGGPKQVIISSTLINEMTENGMAMLSDDAREDVRFADAKSIKAEGVRSLVASPLIDEEGTHGMIILYSCSIGGQFTEEDMELLVSLASVATLRLRNLSLLDESARRLREMNRMLEQRVTERTQALNARNEELETLDLIVRTINLEHELEKVLHRLLEQGLVLFSQASKGAFMLRNEETNAFTFVATVGYGPELMTQKIDIHDALDRYTFDHSQIEQGVYLIEDVPDLPDSLTLTSSQKPKSMLCMSLDHESEVMGLLVLSNYSETESFNFSDLRRLARFRDHATAAVAKALLLRSLEEKNDKIARTQTQLLMQEKLASVGQLTAGVSHEINNPNNFIYAGSQNLDSQLADFRELLRELAADEPEILEDFEIWFSKMKGQVDIIKEGSLRIDGIVKSLQTVTRLDEAERKFVDLGDNLLSTVELMKALYYHKLDFHCEVHDKLEMECWPAELNQVFTNLITNSYEAIMERAQGEDSEWHGKLTITARREDNRALITFCDNGQGVSPKIRDKIFQAFFTTKPPGSGPGLGLYTAYTILRKHGGQIGLIEDIDEGACFYVYLPL